MKLKKGKKEDNDYPFKATETKGEKLQRYIYENTPLILNNTLHNYIKEPKYIEMKDDTIKNDIFSFSSFINSCKEYDNISELKKDIKDFLKNKNENIENYFHILYNYVKKILNLISTKEFFNEKKNIEILIKIMTTILDEHSNKDTNLDKINAELISIQQKLIYKYKNIISKFKENNTLKNCVIFISQLNKKIEDLEKYMNKISTYYIKKTNKIILLKDNSLKEKENENLNNKIKKKKKEDKIYNNSRDENISNNNIENKNYFNINKIDEKNVKKKYNYENLSFPPIQNDEDNFDG